MEMNFKTRRALVKALEKIVDAVVAYYRTDWTEYDRPGLLDPKKYPAGVYVWMPRSSGTYIFPAAEADCIESVLTTWAACEAYIIDLHEGGSATARRVSHADALAAAHRAARQAAARTKQAA